MVLDTKDWDIICEILKEFLYNAKVTDTQIIYK